MRILSTLVCTAAYLGIAVWAAGGFAQYAGHPAPSSHPGAIAGGFIRLVPVFVLGKRLRGLVAIQPGHQLVTNGIYRAIRHPSYLGLLVLSFGWALAFRSGIGLLIAALSVPVLIVRMNAEEALLATQFGAEYAAYHARTRRLLPGVY